MKRLTHKEEEIMTILWRLEKAFVNDILNEMDEADLKEHYLKLLSNSARSEHGGAGLGLLTMARKSAKPIVVRTARLCSMAAFLIMEVRIPA